MGVSPQPGRPGRPLVAAPPLGAGGSSTAGSKAPALVGSPLPGPGAQGQGTASLEVWGHCAQLELTTSRIKPLVFNVHLSLQHTYPHARTRTPLHFGLLVMTCAQPFHGPVGGPVNVSQETGRLLPFGSGDTEGASEGRPTAAARTGPPTPGAPWSLRPLLTSHSPRPTQGP